MRIRDFFLASLLSVTLGCPGDDGGDTDANTSLGTTTDALTTGTTETPGSTTEAPGSTTEAPGSTTETPGSTTETPADTSTSDDPSTTTEGGVSPACEQFCSDYFGVCGASRANDYGDEAGCHAACEGYDQATFDCKEYHASMADGPGSVHCGHANASGGGVC
jgi:hypothetical protein